VSDPEGQTPDLRDVGKLVCEIATCRRQRQRFAVSGGDGKPPKALNVMLKKLGILKLD
jgi:hypothetical protein